MFRRLLSSSSRVASEAQTQVALPHIEAKLLPPVLQRFIRKQLSKDPSQTVIRNPFLVHSYTVQDQAQRLDLPPENRIKRVHVPAVFSVRRQKQLLEKYPAHHLPSSATNPVNSMAVQLESGELIRWEKHVPAQTQSRGVYGKRKVMFKGTLAERDHNNKIKERESRLEGMEQRIEAWKKTKAETKAATKPSLPF